MKNLNIFFDDHEFGEMLKAKAKLCLTWKEVIFRGLKLKKMKGGKDGKNNCNTN